MYSLLLHVLLGPPKAAPALFCTLEEVSPLILLILNLSGHAVGVVQEHLEPLNI